MSVPPLRIRNLGTAGYLEVWRAMTTFTAERGPVTPDEMWTVEHPPVYTQGLNCALEPSARSEIPVVKTDRGGQITYHGPGQLVVYVLLDLRRRRLGVKNVVHGLEQAVIDLLAGFDIEAERIDGAPGVYVRDEKVAALGLRVRRGATYHGLSLNVDMDLTPFTRIDPCGYAGLKVTQLRALGVQRPMSTIRNDLVARLRMQIEGPAPSAAARQG
ncbi:MAG: lipoyl(octanoyl) transferase LipB [Gammaproteobacteria bacterium]|nr:lipoyl(octanoyl) transferase LipB [Gammaproteobacteria bacterium]